MNYTRTAKQLERNYDKKKTVKVKDASYIFKEPPKKNENKIMYEVFIKKYPPINLGLTVIHPGKVNGEFHMTKGHYHKYHPLEFYILLEGKGKLLLQKANKTKAINLKKGENTLIPKGYAHRLINTGRSKLKVLTVYHEDSKPEYDIKFKKRFKG